MCDHLKFGVMMCDGSAVEPLCVCYFSLGHYEPSPFLDLMPFLCTSLPSPPSLPSLPSHTQVASLLASCGGCQPGDLLLLAAGPKPVVLRSLDRVRQFLGRELGLIKAGQQSLLWVVDFPMFEFDEEEKR